MFTAVSNGVSDFYQVKIVNGLEFQFYTNNVIHASFSCQLDHIESSVKRVLMRNHVDLVDRWGVILIVSCCRKT